MPTFEDIAKLAGVSKSSVSLAFSDSPKISLETKIKIRNIAKSIGYDMSGLDSGRWLRNATIGILYVTRNPDFEKEFFSDTLNGVTEEARSKGYDVIFIGSHMQKDGQDATEDITEQVIRSGIEGVIVISSISNLRGFGKLQDMRFPMVFVGDRNVDGSARHIFSVCSDHYNGGKMAAEYLFDTLGHTRISVVVRPNLMHWEKDRSNGFLSHMRECGFPDVEKNTLSVSEKYSQSDKDWGMLDEIRPTALFAVNASIGIAVLHYLRSARKQVPDDISLLVFDDFASFPHEHPPITVIKQHKEALGSQAVRLLADLLQGAKTPPRQLLISTELIERNSCAKATGS